jgi:hypothetical protein
MTPRSPPPPMPHPLSWFCSQGINAWLVPAFFGFVPFLALLAYSGYYKWRHGDEPFLTRLLDNEKRKAAVAAAAAAAAAAAGGAGPGTAGAGDAASLDSGVSYPPPPPPPPTAWPQVPKFIEDWVREAMPTRPDWSTRRIPMSATLQQARGGDGGAGEGGEGADVVASSGGGVGHDSDEHRAAHGQGQTHAVGSSPSSSEADARGQAPGKLTEEEMAARVARLETELEHMRAVLLGKVLSTALGLANGKEEGDGEGQGQRAETEVQGRGAGGAKGQAAAVADTARRAGPDRRPPA